MRIVRWTLHYFSVVVLIGASAANAFVVRTVPPLSSRVTTPTTRRDGVEARAGANDEDFVKLLLPDYSDKQIWRAQDAELNIVNKYLILHNFTIETSISDKSTLKDPPHPLSIGRIYAHWETFWFYERSFDIDLHNIDLYLEVTKGLLSSSNWNELNDDDFYDWVSADVEDENELVHFSSIRMTGNLSITVASRPLGKTIASFTLNLDEAVVDDNLNAQICALSEKNLATKGRKGCTSAEILALLKEFVYDQIRSVMSFSQNKD